MKKHFLTALALAIGAINAQDRCGHVAYQNYVNQLNPGYQEAVNQAFNDAQESPNVFRANETLTIPVVVHVIYNLPEENLADSVIYHQLMTLNHDYMRWNADTVNMRADFEDVKGRPNIQFELADFDPNGNPTTGITRTYTALESFGTLNSLFGDFTDIEKIKSTADGGVDPWDQSKYLNIWVADMSVFDIPALLGYATPPDNLSNWPAGSVAGLSDGVVIQYQAFGANNPNDLDMGQGPIDVEGRTLTHEVGHYLGLRHIWGDGDCNEQDGIDDTPNAVDQSQFDCDDTKNTCVDNINGVDLPDMIENYMDYSAETCQNSFTQGQVDHMRTVITNNRGGLIDNGTIDAIAEFNFVHAVYPNPGTHGFSWSSSEKVNVLDVFNMQGQKLESIKIENQNSVQLNQLNAGVYLIRFNNESGNTQTVIWRKN